MADVGELSSQIVRWDNLKHSRPLVQKDYGSWLKIKILHLDYWCRSTFEVIGDHFGGLTDIASETLNLTNISEAQIQVKKKLCGFVPSTIEITNLKRENIYLHFRDFEFLNPTDIDPSSFPSARNQCLQFFPETLFGFIPSSTPFPIKTEICWKYTALKFRPVNASLGSPCKADYSFKNQLDISSPFSVSSKESAGAFSAFDLKLDSEIEGVDINALFNDEGFSPNKVPMDLPKYLLPIVNDCGITLA
ncbi:hypothetical protein E6C27_scaffold112G00020 [Cucumis melo var. makuwa]|uniref:DUF4283 domain-containing protein n=1 Tax=Cucumis melo var. makuwa TaxID=1194695 RepID=A0A5A7T365_CUCMM|nr:hypothetical protein E6C27_scaffold112G00020 [Cucumis melo var. makuwa]